MPADTKGMVKVVRTVPVALLLTLAICLESKRMDIGMFGENPFPINVIFSPWNAEPFDRIIGINSFS